ADVEDLGEKRLVRRLAVLLGKRLRHTLAVVDHPAPQLVHHLAAAVEAERLPGGLRGPGTIYEPLHASRIEIRHAGDRRAGSRVLDREGGLNLRCCLDYGHALLLVLELDALDLRIFDRLVAG